MHSHPPRPVRWVAGSTTESEFPMTENQFSLLKPGDIIRPKNSGEALLVSAVHGTKRNPRIIGVRIVEVTNPIEWDQVDEMGRVITVGSAL